MGYSESFQDEVFNNRLRGEAVMVQAFLKDNPGSRPIDVSRGLELRWRETQWTLHGLLRSGDVVRTQRNNGRGVRYYLPGQPLDPEDDITIDAAVVSEILETASLLMDKRNGEGVRARDIRYAITERGHEAPTNYKIAAVLRANGYMLDPERSRYSAAYILPQET